MKSYPMMENVLDSNLFSLHYYKGTNEYQFLNLEDISKGKIIITCIANKSDPHSYGLN